MDAATTDATAEATLAAVLPARAARAPAPPRTLDLAIAGTRGVPACYSGFETFAEELGARLAARGHRVTVYGRTAYVGRARRLHRGIEVVPLPALAGKHLETPSHTLLSALAALRARHDAVLLCNGANAFAAPLFRAGGARVAINVDGLDRLRRKWGLVGRLWHGLGERLALRLADQPVVDAECLAAYYRERHAAELPVIAYGGDRVRAPGAGDEVLARLGLERGGYVLLVGRLEPENNALLVARAYRRVGGARPLVVVGDAPYAAAYKAAVRAAADPRVRFAGWVFGDAYLALQEHAACYVAAGEVGGTHPALVEAMTAGAAVVANDVPEHREALGDAALYYAPGDEAGLAAALDRALGEPALRAELRRRARARAAARYRWEDVARRYERLLLDLVERAR